MYNKHFGLSESPFNITPNSRFYFRTQSCNEILRIVKHGIESRKGVMVVTGEPGTGKTLLVKCLERDLSPTVQTVTIQNPHTHFDRMLEVVLNRLDLHDAGDNRTARLDRLTVHLIEQHSQRGIVCLLVDEAQDLDINTLDELRLLANLEVDGDALLSLLLIGQSELKVKLDHPSATRIKQRIALTRNTHPLVRMEIAPYIQWRLKVAGLDNRGLFDAEAIDAIAAYSGGIPRMINSICDNALIRAYTAKQSAISFAVIDQVTRDLRIASPLSFERQFARTEPVAHSGDCAPIADPGEYAGEEVTAVPAGDQAANSTGAETLQPDKAQAPVLSRPISTRHGAVLVPLQSAAHSRASANDLPGVHAVTAIPRDVLPVRVRWYAAAAVIGLLILSLNLVSNSLLPNIFSAAPKARQTPIFDASPYRSLQWDAADSVKFTGTLVALANPTKPLEDAKVDGQNVSRGANGKKTGPIKASQPQLPRDAGPRHDKAAGLPKRSEDAGKTVKVLAPSLLRNKPSASAKIISSLEPGSRVIVLAKSGDFYHIRFADKQALRGYVHREDAFFERRK